MTVNTRQRRIMNGGSAAALVLLAMAAAACSPLSPAPGVTAAMPTATFRATETKVEPPATATITPTQDSATPTPDVWKEGRTEVLTFSGTGLDVPSSCLVEPEHVAEEPLLVGGKVVTDGVTIDTTQNVTDKNGPHLVDTLLVPARPVSIDIIGSGTSGRENKPVNIYRLCYKASLPDSKTHTINHLVIASVWTTGSPVPAFVLPRLDVPEVVLDQTIDGSAPLVGMTDQFVEWFHQSIGKQVLLVVSSESSGDPAQNPKLQDIIHALRAGQMPSTSDSFTSASGPKIGQFFVLTPDQEPPGTVH